MVMCTLVKCFLEFWVNGIDAVSTHEDIHPMINAQFNRMTTDIVKLVITEKVDPSRRRFLVAIS